MALNIKNPEVEILAAEVARLAQETKTEAIRQALLERKARLQVRGRGVRARSGWRHSSESGYGPIYRTACAAFA